VSAGGSRHLILGAGQGIIGRLLLRGGFGQFLGGRVDLGLRLLLLLLRLGQGRLGRVGGLALGGGVGGGLLLLRLGNGLGVGLRSLRRLLGGLVSGRGSGNLVLDAGQRLVGRFLRRLSFGQLLRCGADLGRRSLLVLLCPGQGGLGSVSRSAAGDRLGRSLLGLVVELVGRIGGGLRRGRSLLGRLLRRVVRLLQGERGGLGLLQRLVQGGLGVGRLGQGLGGFGQIRLGLLQLCCARLAGQVLRIRGLLSLRVGRSARVGVIRVSLLHGRLEGGESSLRVPGCLQGRIVGGLGLGLRGGLGRSAGRLRLFPGARRKPNGNREGSQECQKGLDSHRKSP